MQTKPVVRHSESASATPRKAWRKPVVKVHGDLAVITRAKNPGGTDSGLGTPIT